MRTIVTVPSGAYAFVLPHVISSFQNNQGFPKLYKVSNIANKCCQSESSIAFRNDPKVQKVK